MAPQPLTISQQVNAERLALLGWTRAILLQFAHPLVAAAVSDHSAFGSSPFAAMARLHGTLRAMLDISFGDRRVSDRALNGIRTIHRRINGRLPHACGTLPAGAPYSATDPDLLLWVHATLLESLPIVHDLIVAPLTIADRDRYCEEAAPVAVALGARDAEVPRSWAALRAYMASMYASGRIAISPQAFTLSRRLLAPPMSAAIAPARWANQLIATGLLPSPLRAQYRFRWTRDDERHLHQVLVALRVSRRALPDLIALWPDARRRPATPVRPPTGR